MAHCARRSADSYFGQECRHLMAVPLTYRGRVLGLYNLFFDARRQSMPKRRRCSSRSASCWAWRCTTRCSSASTLRATVLRERQAMAAEVHDSIAQTLAFVKMRMPLLQEAIAAHDEAAA